MLILLILTGKCTYYLQLYTAERANRKEGQTAPALQTTFQQLNTFVKVTLEDWAFGRKRCGNTVKASYASKETQRKPPADILYLLSLPLLVAYYANEQNWTFGQGLCKITRFLFSINLYGSIGFLMFISVYRYLSIVHPLKVKGRITVHHSLGITAVVWILVFLQSLPDVYYDKTDKNVSACYDTTLNNSTKMYLRYSILRTVTGFVIPLIVMVCCYGHVAVVLAAKKDSEYAILRLRCLRLVVVLALLFSVCYIPYHIFRNLNLQSRIWKTSGYCRGWFANIYIANQVSNGLDFYKFLTNVTVSDFLQLYRLPTGSSSLLQTFVAIQKAENWPPVRPVTRLSFCFSFLHHSVCFCLAFLTTALA
ncbi:hypothetical protein NFI96_027852 [Prochilodus magdalenae]|nr:hypothetical protein NFI96_027852 [Prochilodus magdalenae]